MLTCTILCWNVYLLFVAIDMCLINNNSIQVLYFVHIQWQCIFQIINNPTQLAHSLFKFTGQNKKVCLPKCDQPKHSQLIALFFNFRHVKFPD